MCHILVSYPDPKNPVSAPGICLYATHKSATDVTVHAGGTPIVSGTKSICLPFYTIAYTVNVFNSYFIDCINCPTWSPVTQIPFSNSCFPCLTIYYHCRNINSQGEKKKIWLENCIIYLETQVIHNFKYTSWCFC